MKKEETRIETNADDNTDANEEFGTDKIVDIMRKMQGNMTQSSFAASLGCSTAYISEVYRGSREPGPKIIDKLGIERVVVYRRKRWR